MKKKFFLICVVFAFSQMVYPTNWLRSFEEAKVVSLNSNKLMLVDFWASWCGPCKKMDRESWSDQDVINLMANFVPVQIDIDRNKSIAQQYGVKAIPYVYIMDGNGKVLYRSMSYKSKSEVISLLKEFSLNLQSLQYDLVNFYNKKNFTNAFRVASKYHEIGLYVPKGLKRNFMNISNTYFDIAKTSIKDKELEDTFLQKIRLYGISEKLIYGNLNRAKKLISKVDKSDIDSINIPLYAMLNYIIAKIEGNPELAEEWKTEMSSTDLRKAKQYLKSYKI